MRSERMPSDDEIRRIIIKKKKRSAAIRRALFAALLLIVLIILLPARRSGGFDKEVIRPTGDLAAEAPEIKAGAAALYSLDMDQFVYEKNAEEKIDPYSITKILTCYLTLENLELSQKITVQKSNADLNYVDGSHILLLKGEKITVEDLLYGTMLSSANDAAYALGVAVAGSESKFAEMMNNQVAEWGCNNTHFVNTNGWKNKEHYTTAHDMSIITARCFENEKLREISMTKEHKIPATNMSEERELENVFLKSTDKITSISCGKTGSWEEDDCSIALEFSEGNLNAAMVLLRDTMKKRHSDIKKLIDFSHRVTPGFIVAAEGDSVCRARVKGGSRTETQLEWDKTLYAYPRDNKAKSIKVDVETDGIEAPIKAGDAVGTYVVSCDGREIGKGSLLASEDINEGWILSRFYISDKATVMGASAIALFTCLALIIKAATSRSRRRRKR